MRQFQTLFSGVVLFLGVHMNRSDLRCHELDMFSLLTALTGAPYKHTLITSLQCSQPHSFTLLSL